MTTPRERRHDLNRQKILDTARKLILTDGLEGLSIRKLAEQVDYSPSAIYKYYESKEEIFQALREEGWRLADEIQTARTANCVDAAELLLVSGRAYLEFAETYPDYYHLIFDIPDELLNQSSDVITHPEFQGAINIFRRGVAEGTFQLPAGFTPELMAVMIWTSIHGMATQLNTSMRAHPAEFRALCDLVMTTFAKSITVK